MINTSGNLPGISVLPGRLRAVFFVVCLFFSSFVLAEAPTPMAPLKVPAPLSVGPKQTNMQNQADKLSLTIEEVTVVDHGTAMSWYAKTVNRGQRIAKDQLEIRGYQMIGSRSLGDTGPVMTSGKVLSEGETRTFARQNWPRLSGAGQLKVVITDKSTGRSTFKIVNLPRQDNRVDTPSAGAAGKVGKMAPGQFTVPEQQLKVEAAAYLGRGAYQIRLKNSGNRGVGPEQLTLRPYYHVKNRPPVQGKTATNPSGIIANGSKLVSSDGGGIYTDGMAECSLLEKVVLEVTNPLTGQVLEHAIPVPKPKGKIVDVDMYLSNLTYTVKNTGAYKSKFKVRLLSMGVYKGKYDHLATVHDLLHTSVTVEPGNAKTVSIPRERVNAELKAQLPSLKSRFYGADHYMAELYTEYESDYCRAQPFAIDQASLRRHGGEGEGEEILIGD